MILPFNSALMISRIKALLFILPLYTCVPFQLPAITVHETKIVATEYVTVTACGPGIETGCVLQDSSLVELKMSDNLSSLVPSDLVDADLVIISSETTTNITGIIKSMDLETPMTDSEPDSSLMGSSSATSHISRNDTKRITINTNTINSSLPLDSISDTPTSSMDALSDTPTSSMDALSDTPTSSMDTLSDTPTSSSSVLSSSNLETSTASDINYVNSYDSTKEVLWDRFWNHQKKKLNENDQICEQSYKEPSVWNLAVVARAMIESKDIDKTHNILSNLYEYQNQQLKVFSASTAKDEDIYNDDNAQIAWCYLAGYQLTQEQKYLDTAKDIIKFLMNQTDDNGGTIWKYKHEYIASISTIESGLAALKLYEITGEIHLLTFGKKSLDFLYNYLQDPNDKLFYDGLNKDYTGLNKGKLSYTVGCALSSLKIVFQNDGSQNSNKWLQKITELGDASTNQQGAFYNTEKLWNNSMKYIQLLYLGFNDIFTLPYDFHSYKSEVIRQANFIETYLRDPQDNLYFESINSCPASLQLKYEKVYDTSVGSDTNINTCQGIVSKSLMENGSILQILYQISRNFI